MKATDHYTLTSYYKSSGKKVREKIKKSKASKRFIDPVKKHGLAFK